LIGFGESGQGVAGDNSSMPRFHSAVGVHHLFVAAAVTVNELRGIEASSRRKPFLHRLRLVLARGDCDSSLWAARGASGLQAGRTRGLVRDHFMIAGTFSFQHGSRTARRCGCGLTFRVRRDFPTCRGDAQYGRNYFLAERTTSAGGVHHGIDLLGASGAGFTRPANLHSGGKDFPNQERAFVSVAGARGAGQWLCFMTVNLAALIASIGSGSGAGAAAFW